MLWLGLYLPRLAIEVFLRSGASDRTADNDATTDPDAPENPSGPLIAVCDHQKVLLASASAERLGVRGSMKRATALALAPDLQLLERDATREREALEQLACWLLQFTPSIAFPGSGPTVAGSERRKPGMALPRSGVVLEIEPSLQLFGGLEVLLGRIRAGVQALGFTACLACAPTAHGAWLLCGSGEDITAIDPAQLNARLANLPIMLLEAASPHRDSLEAIGVRNVRELLRLPRAGLARRFGQALLDELDQALGQRPEAHAWFEAPAVYRARLELLADIDDAQALLFAAHRLLMQMTGWLTALHSAVRDFELFAEHDDRPATRWLIRMTEPSRELDRMTTLLRERLAVSRLPAPAHTLVLASGEVVPLTPPNEELFPTPQAAHESLARLIERLQARLGRRQIQRLSLAEDHRPEAAYRVEEIDEAPSAGPRPSGTQRPAGSRRSSEVQRPKGARPSSGGPRPTGMQPSATQPPTTQPPTTQPSATQPSATQPPTATQLPAATQQPAVSRESAATSPTSTTEHAPSRSVLATSLPRPLWLLPVPIPVSERNNRPYWRSPLNLLAGPERIESGWWDGALVQRDYFIAEDEMHLLYWIYRERLGKTAPREGWFIQGRFG